jgi:potassium-dependent mechanosensitive channel
VDALGAARVAAALGGAALVHFALARLGRRLPRWLELRRGGAGAPHSHRPSAVSLAVLALQAAVWLGALELATRELAPLRHGRMAFVELVVRSLRAPLFSQGERSYSAVDLLALPALVVGVWLAVSGFTRLFRSTVLSSAGFDAGLQETLSVLLRYALAFLGTLVVLQAWGVDLRTLAILASVLGVGIGFGLQNIANNFVSGVLINLERPIRPGDFVHVGEFAGTVQRIGARSTEIRTADQVSILVPNARFLETEVVNWSHGDPVSRVHVPIGVAYGSDPRRVRRALLAAARGHRAVLREPRPQVQLRRFGDSTIEFELLVWTRDPRNQQLLASDLNFRIEETLRQERIVIPFPQQDLNVRWPTAERLLEAFGQERWPGALGEEPAEQRAADGSAPDDALAEHGPEEWSDAEVAAWAAKLRAADGVPVADRRWLLSVHRACFAGSEAVDWLVRHADLTRHEAAALGERMIALGLLRHVLDEHGFHDGHFFYRFADPQPAPAR